MSLFVADGNEDNGADGNTEEEGGQSENSSPEHVVTKPTTIVKVIFSTTKVRHQSSHPCIDCASYTIIIYILRKFNYGS